MNLVTLDLGLEMEDDAPIRSFSVLSCWNIR